MTTSMAEMFQLVAGNVWLYGGSFLLVLSILVFIHEFGHYYIARLCGVRVEVFSIGFGREIWGFNDKHGTRWKFSLIPLGGYVKMFGDSDPASAGHTDKVKGEGGEAPRAMTEAERKEAFFAKPVGQRAAIVFAGPAINYLFAVVLLAGLFMFHGQDVTPAESSAVIAGSAADKAGFKPHDVILTIDGQPIDRFDELRRSVMVKLDTPMEFTVNRAGEVITLTATPERMETEDRHGFKSTRGMLGVISPGDGLAIDNIVAVNGQRTETPEAIRAALLANMGKTFTIMLDRGAKEEGMVVQPLLEQNQDLKNPESEGYNVLVVAQGAPQKTIRHNPIGAVGAAVAETWSVTTSTLEAIGQMFTGTRSATELGGIIRIGALAGDMAQVGILALISFTALLSINLGLINLFPIPMLDGGHLAFYAVEAVKGGPISEQFQEYAFRFGLAILVGIMLFANLNDIVQLVL